MMSNPWKKFMLAEEALEVLFQNDYADFDSDSSSYKIHKSGSNISMQSD